MPSQVNVKNARDEKMISLPYHKYGGNELNQRTFWSASIFECTIFFVNFSTLVSLKRVAA